MILSRRKNRSLHRIDAYLEPYDIVLIVCEGSETEPCYFEKLISKENLSSANIEVTGDCGSDPLSVVNHAIQLLKKREEDQNEERKYDRVYCLIDRDEHHHFDAAINKIYQFNKHISKNILIPIRSWPCFEYWYICHFEYSRAVISKKGKKSPGTVCEEYLNKILKAKFGISYKKSDRQIYSLIEDYQKDGIRHSKQALRDAQDISSHNPSTEVHLLVEYLLNLKRKPKSNHKTSFQ